METTKLIASLLVFLLVVTVTTDRAEALEPVAKVIMMDSGFGGATGLLLATGVTLMQKEPTTTRNFRLGVGLGLIGGAVLGLVESAQMQRNGDSLHYGPDMRVAKYDAQTVLINTGYGAACGALLAGGVSLIEKDPDTTRNFKVGVGAGLIGGTIFGLWQINQTQPSYGSLMNVEEGNVTIGLPDVLLAEDDVQIRAISWQF